LTIFSVGALEFISPPRTLATLNCVVRILVSLLRKHQFKAKDSGIDFWLGFFFNVQAGYVHHPDSCPKETFGHLLYSATSV
jgi:hypothetical protein